MVRRTLACAVATSVVAVAAACGGSSTPAAAPAAAAPPLSAPQLTALLLTAADLPAGYTVQSTAPNENSGLRTREPDCSEFRLGFDFVDNAAPASAQVAALVIQPDAAGYGWRGVETLRAYPGDGAHSVMATIRRYVAKCPSGVDLSGDPTKFAVAPGTGTGDESLTVTARTTKNEGIRVADTDITFIRRGGVLIALHENASLAPDTGVSDQLIAVAKAADAKAAEGTAVKG
ncbi:MAG: hypothetical protein ACJ786_08605 [Catenulispora sp.]